MEIQEFTKLHICNQLFNELLNPDVAKLITSYLPLRTNQTINGKKEGVWKRWYENGLLSYECCYKNNKLDGVQTSWYNNGRKRYKWEYKDDNLDGISKGWDRNGQFKYETYYKMGEQIFNLNSS